MNSSYRHMKSVVSVVRVVYVVRIVSVVSAVSVVCLTAERCFNFSSRSVHEINTYSEFFLPQIN